MKNSYNDPYSVTDKPKKEKEKDKSHVDKNIEEQKKQKRDWNC